MPPVSTSRCPSARLSTHTWRATHSWQRHTTYTWQHNARLSYCRQPFGACLGSADQRPELHVRWSLAADGIGRALRRSGSRATSLRLSAPRLGPLFLHLRRDWAHPSHICTGTALAAATSAPGLGPPLPTPASGLGSPLPHLHRDWAGPYGLRMLHAGAVPIPTVRALAGELRQASTVRRVLAVLGKMGQPRSST